MIIFVSFGLCFILPCVEVVVAVIIIIILKNTSQPDRTQLIQHVTRWTQLVL